MLRDRIDPNLVKSNSAVSCHSLLVEVSMNRSIAIAMLSIGTVAASGLQPQYARTGHGGEIATATTLPSLGGNSQALAIDDEGTTVVGSSFDRSDLLHAVTWTLQGDGSWKITDLGWPPDAVSSIARGINNNLDVAGNDFSPAASRPLLWPITGGITILSDCSGSAGRAIVYGLSANAQVAVGATLGVGGSVWSPAGCESLPPLPGGTSPSAFAVNGDGTIVGGASATQTAASVPVRWTHVAGQWQIEQLDSRSGLAVGANTVGDLAGSVTTACALPDGCSRAVIWYAAGGSRELGTLGGDQSWASDINSSGELVGGSTAPRVGNTAYFWSESRGMLQLPFKGRFAVANALSDVRPDGTRIVVGTDSRANAIVWVVRNP